MIQIDSNNRPGLLVSVRNASEALAALAGGADVIDVKEPDRGALGAADLSTIAAVVRAVNGRVPVTAAAGELLDLSPSKGPPMPDGVSLFKIGLAGCRAIPHWPLRWRDTFSSFASGPDACKQAVAVAYADWRTAGAPHPHDVLRAAVELGCPALLVDTWDKSAGSLFDHWPAGELCEFVAAARSHRLMVVLAGSLAAESFAAAATLGPDLVAVRTAACDCGRGGTVSLQRVKSLRQAITPQQLTLHRVCHSEVLRGI